MLRLRRQVLPRGVEVEAQLLAERAEQPAEVVGDVRRATTGWIAPSSSVSLGSGTTSSGSTSIRVPRPWHSGQAPNGELNENDRGSSSSMSIRCSLGQAMCSENSSSRLGSLSAQVDEVEDDQPAGQTQRRLDRVGQPALARTP